MTTHSKRPVTRFLPSGWHRLFHRLVDNPLRDQHQRPLCSKWNPGCLCWQVPSLDDQLTTHYREDQRSIIWNIQELSTQALRNGVQLSPDLSRLPQRASLQLLQAVQHLRAHRQSWGKLQPSGVLEPGILPQLCSTAMYLILWIVLFNFFFGIISMNIFYC